VSNAREQPGPSATRHPFAIAVQRQVRVSAGVCGTRCQSVPVSWWDREDFPGAFQQVAWPGGIRIYSSKRRSGVISICPPSVELPRAYGVQSDEERGKRPGTWWCKLIHSLLYGVRPPVGILRSEIQNILDRIHFNLRQSGQTLFS
jgi:hypothetical protein